MCFVGEPLEKMELPLRTWDENCVDMDVICCGMCGTDIHTLDESFGPGTSWPCVVGMLTSNGIGHMY